MCHYSVIIFFLIFVKQLIHLLYFTNKYHLLFSLSFSFLFLSSSSSMCLPALRALYSWSFLLWVSWLLSTGDTSAPSPNAHRMHSRKPHRYREPNTDCGMGWEDQVSTITFDLEVTRCWGPNWVLSAQIKLFCHKTLSCLIINPTQAVTA